MLYCKLRTIDFLVMKKKLSVFICSCILLITSCGDYVETKIDLTSAQETAILNFMTQECITKNADLFNALGTNTVDWNASDLDKSYVYNYETTGKEKKKFVILRKTASVMYVFVEATDGDDDDRVYKYTTTDNANHMTNIKTLACRGTNSFTGDSSNFSYTAKENDPTSDDEDRTEYNSTYRIKGARPIFFSLFDRQYTKKVYVDDAVDTTTDITVSYKITTTGVTLSDYETPFTNALHCTFNTTTPAWLGADFPTTFESSLATTCTTGVFNWDNDIDV